MNRSHRARTLLRLIAATGLLVILGIAVLLELRLVVILSGSMEPSISTGSICFISGADRRGVPGKVVAYELKDHLVVHRISRCVSGGESFITKGDSNDTEDPIPVSAKQIRGRVIGTISVSGIWRCVSEKSGWHSFDSGDGIFSHICLLSARRPCIIDR